MKIIIKLLKDDIEELRRDRKPRLFQSVVEDQRTNKRELWGDTDF